MNEPQWLVRARDLVGLREINGPAHEPEVLRMWKDAHMEYIHDDETAWCAAFVGAMLERSGVNCTRKPNARSYEYWGIDCLNLGIDKIPLGAVLVYSRPPNPEQGHVNFAVGRTEAGDVIGLGGNQGDRVSIAPFKASRLIAARWPSEFGDDLGMLRAIPLVATSAPLSVREA